MEHDLKVYTYEGSLPPGTTKYTGTCSCMGWDYSSDTRSFVVMAHGDHVQQEKKKDLPEKKWTTQEHLWSGHWTDPEPSDGPEVLSITGKISPRVVSMEVVFDNGQRKLYKKVKAD